MNASDQNDPPEWNPFQNDHFQNKCTRKGKGRQKINIAKIENENNLQVTFSKRRAGLFKKASELSTLTGAEIAVLVFSPSGKAHSFAHPNIEIVSNRFLNPSQNQNQPRDETNPYIVAQRNATILQNNQKLIQLENLLDHEKKRAKENDKNTQEILRQGHWNSTRVLALRDNEVYDFGTKFLNFKVSFDNRVENHRASLMNPNPNPNQYPDPSPIPKPDLCIPGQNNPGTETDGINFTWQNQNGTNYFGLPNNSYNVPGPSDLSFYENQEGSMFFRGFDPSSSFDNMTGNLNGSNFMDMSGPSGTNLTGIIVPSGTNIVDVPGPSGTNLMDPISDPMWEQFSAFSFHGNLNSSTNVTFPVNPNIDDVVPYVLPPGNSMVPLMQDNLENMLKGFNNSYSGDGNFAVPNQGNVQNMFSGFNNINNWNYTVSNQENIHNMLLGTFNNNNNGNENFTMPGLGNVQNMFQGLNNNNNNNNNNNGYENSAAPGQINELQTRFQAFNNKNGRAN